MKKFKKIIKRIGILSSQNAFSMVEIALAISIMAIGIVSILGIMPTLLKSNRQAIDASRVAIIAQRRMDGEDTSNDKPKDLYDQLQKAPTTTNETYDAFYVAARTFVTNSFEVDLETNPSNPVAKEYNLKLNNPLAPNYPLLITKVVTYSWPPNSSKAQSYSFYTEYAAKYSIPLP
jgi:type II secretory pathway pseudopilin PulG